ncbi:hypothetical protein Q4485_07015 [Granulosicoccaceae sp. 1_MG-2023]|nr:hypothetical protein [Granulosicoccaceae sp. 1_MG-2023]
MARLDQITIDVLSENQVFLEENADDITYRMYDILFRRYPHLRGFFGQSRQSHPNLLRLLLECFGVEEGQPARCIDHVVEQAAVCIKPEHLKVFRRASVQAMQDVLFHEATPELVKAWKAAFDAFATALEEADSLTESA